MTNNRKPLDEVRLSLSAAREEDGQPLHIATEGSLNQLPTKHKPGWHRAPDPALYSRHEATPHKGRDYEAILRAAKKAPVGYWEDAPTGIKFGASSARSPEASEVGGLTKTPTHAPTPPQSADGGQPLPSASTKPHGKDIDTPWPKCTKMAHSEEYHLWRTETEGIWFDSAGLKGVCGTPSFTCAMTECNRIEVSRAEMAGFLEAHGHKDVAAQLRGKEATGGGRVWRDGGFAWVQIGGVMYSRVPVGHFVKCVSGRMSYMMPEWEIFGPERDAVLAECRKAMSV